MARALGQQASPLTGFRDSDFAERLRKRMTLPRYGATDAVAAMVAYLAGLNVLSEESLVPSMAACIRSHHGFPPSLTLRFEVDSIDHRLDRRRDGDGGRF